MVNANHELERGLESRPLPGKQVRVSLSQIVKQSQRGRRKTPGLLAAGMATAIVAVAVVVVAQSAFWPTTSDPGSAEETALLSQPPLGTEKANAAGGVNETDDDGQEIEWVWSDRPAYETPTPFADWVDGYYQENPTTDEWLHETQVSDQIYLQFVRVSENKIGVQEFKWELQSRIEEAAARVSYFWDWKPGARFEFTKDPYQPGEHPSTMSFKHAWAGVGVEEDGQEEKKMISFLYGWMYDPLISQIRVSNSTGLEQTASIVQDAAGNRYFFVFLLPELDHYSTFIQAYDVAGNLMGWSDIEGLEEPSNKRFLR